MRGWGRINDNTGRKETHAEYVARVRPGEPAGARKSAELDYDKLAEAMMRAESRRRKAEMDEMEKATTPEKTAPPLR
jgi:hypothetical protein